MAGHLTLCAGRSFFARVRLRACKGQQGAEKEESDIGRSRCIKNWSTLGPVGSVFGPPKLDWKLLGLVPNGHLIPIGGDMPKAHHHRHPRYHQGPNHPAPNNRYDMGSEAPLAPANSRVEYHRTLSALVGAQKAESCLRAIEYGPPRWWPSCVSTWLPLGRCWQWHIPLTFGQRGMAVARQRLCKRSPPPLEQTRRDSWLGAHALVHRRSLLLRRSNSRSRDWRLDCVMRSIPIEVQVGSRQTELASRSRPIAAFGGSGGGAKSNYSGVCGSPLVEVRDARHRWPRGPIYPI